MKTIPELREDILDIIHDYYTRDAELCKRLVAIYKQTFRREAAERRVSAKRKKILSSILVPQIKKLHKDRPDYDYQDIATALGTTIGRVSEALTGFRDSERRVPE